MNNWYFISSGNFIYFLDKILMSSGNWTALGMLPLCVITFSTDIGHEFLCTLKPIITLLRGRGGITSLFSKIRVRSRKIGTKRDRCSIHFFKFWVFFLYNILRFLPCIHQINHISTGRTILVARGCHGSISRPGTPGSDPAYTHDRFTLV